MNSIIDGIYYDVLIVDDIKTQETAIKHIAGYLQEKGFVNDKYADATIERERVFPTGLSTFYTMENNGTKIDAGIMFLLALKGENKHLNYLKNIVNYCKYEENLEKLYHIESKAEAYQIFMSQILKLS
ncbi:MAG: putative IIA-like nitrogen-regulatory protein PtsN [Massilibacillus sp.]|nr:putative IIA-like nitrogen-regulatory protein PtsN [Massilibacillus sp.]